MSGGVFSLTWPAQVVRSGDTAPRGWWAHSRAHQSRMPFQSSQRLCPLCIKIPGRHVDAEGSVLCSKHTTHIFQIFKVTVEGFGRDV